MVTYYAGQLGIALSVVDCKAKYKARIEALNSAKLASPQQAIPLTNDEVY